jgi:hypothetical protein
MGLTESQGRGSGRDTAFTIDLVSRPAAAAAAAAIAERSRRFLIAASLGSVVPVTGRGTTPRAG